MIPPQLRKELSMRYKQSFEDLKLTHHRYPTPIETAIHFMLTEDKSPKEIKEIIDLIKENETEGKR